MLELRDEGGVIADGFTSEELAVELEPRGAQHTLVRVAPGMWRMELMAPAGSGGGTLRVRVRFEGAPLLERAVPIAVDRAVAEGRVATRGGCATVPAARSPLAWLGVLLGVLALSRRARTPSTQSAAR